MPLDVLVALFTSPYNIMIYNGAIYLAIFFFSQYIILKNKTIQYIDALTRIQNYKRNEAPHFLIKKNRCCIKLQVFSQDNVIYILF